MLRFSSILGLGLAAGLLVIIILLLILAFEVWMFVSAITNKNIPETSRILWAVGMVLIHPFVAIAYYFTDYKKAG